MFVRRTSRKRSAAGVLASVVVCLFSVAVVSGATGEAASGTVGSDDHGWLGVSLQEQEGQGLIIVEVVPGSPAETAGLQAGDRILAVDGSDRCGLSCLGKKVANAGPGAGLSLRILQDGQEKKIAVVLGSPPPGGNITLHVETVPDVLSRIPKVPRVASESVLEDRLERFLRKVPEGDRSVQWYFFPGSRMGIDLIDIPEELRDHLGGSPGAGVLVGSVKPESPAARAGLQAGDLIVRLDGETVADSGAIARRLGGWSRKEFQVERIRDRKADTVTLLREGVTGVFGPDPRAEGIQKAIRELKRDLKEQEMSDRLRRSLEKIQEDLESLTPDLP